MLVMRGSSHLDAVSGVRMSGMRLWIQAISGVGSAVRMVYVNSLFPANQVISTKKT